MRKTFTKSERLCGQMRIQNLYKEGRRFVVWPLRVHYMPIATNSGSEVVIWAPKSLFKHAVDRNRMRRLMREAWRAEKGALEEKEWTGHIAINYMDKTQQPLYVIQKAVKKAIGRILKEGEKEGKEGKE